MFQRGFFVFLLSLIPGLVFTQDAPRAAEQPPLKLGLGFFGASYSGDLTVKGEGFYRFYPGVNLSLQFATKKLITPQLNAGFGKFISQNRDLEAVEGVMPNTFVETQFFYADFRLRLRFLREKRVNPWLAVGIGLLGYTPRDADGNSLIDNTATRNPGETYGSITAAMPLAAGLEFRLSDLLSFGLEYTHRRSGSDYLDNIAQLGLRNGKDRINSITGTLFITFDPVAIARARLRGKERRDL